jgi:molybdate transport system permease protein
VGDACVVAIKHPFTVCVIIAVSLAAALVMVILASQLYYIGPARPLLQLGQPDVRSAIMLSLYTATAAAVLGLALAIPAAYFLARANLPGKGLLDALLDVPIIMSPLALGTALLLFFRTPAGHWIESNLMEFVFEVPGIILAQFFLALALSVRVLKASFEAVDVRCEQVARFLGCTPWQSFRKITLPIARRGVLAAFILSWARCLGDFGAAVTLAGAIKGKTETMPVSIYLNMASVNIDKAVALMLLTTLLALSVLLAVRFVASGGGARRT